MKFDYEKVGGGYKAFLGDDFMFHIRRLNGNYVASIELTLGAPSLREIADKLDELNVTLSTAERAYRKHNG